MQKYIPGIVIGFVAAVLFGFLMRFVFPEGMASVWYGAFFGVFVAYIFANLAGNRKVPAASEAEKQAVLQLRPPSGKALLVVFREGFVAKLAGLNLFLDHKPFAQLTSPKFTSVVIAPGAHNLSCGFGGLAGPQSQKGSYDFQATAGGFIAVRIGARIGAIQGVMSFTPIADAQTLRTKLAGVPMVKADVAEL
ncbi:MAG: hypothetical protein WDM85_02435 [Caulobacteraceae bacterium]